MPNLTAHIVNMWKSLSHTDAAGHGENPDPFGPRPGDNKRTTPVTLKDLS